MYNSIFGYALKLVKGSIVFSVVLLIAISQTMVITSIYMLVWRYEVVLSDAVSFFKSFSVYSFFISVLIIVITLSLISCFYIFSKNSRMFSTLRIFGATKTALIKLSIIQNAIYSFSSVIVSFITMIILYVRYRDYILKTVEEPQFFAAAFMFLFSNIALALCFILISFISVSILLKKDPYEDLRGTL